MLSQPRKHNSIPPFPIDLALVYWETLESSAAEDPIADCLDHNKEVADDEAETHEAIPDATQNSLFGFGHTALFVAFGLRL